MRHKMHGNKYRLLWSALFGTFGTIREHSNRWFSIRNAFSFFILSNLH